ncbi:hypothetical protein J7L85_04240 [candidate division WOR-3 bacterium]|nr:hypothetical protein [candidate division WOR-3 bacterium]
MGVKERRRMKKGEWRMKDERRRRKDGEWRKKLFHFRGKNNFLALEGRGLR